MRTNVCPINNEFAEGIRGGVISSQLSELLSSVRFESVVEGIKPFQIMDGPEAVPGPTGQPDTLIECGPLEALTARAFKTLEGRVLTTTLLGVEVSRQR